MNARLSVTGLSDPTIKVDVEVISATNRPGPTQTPRTTGRATAALSNGPVHALGFMFLLLDGAWPPSYTYLPTGPKRSSLH